MVKYLNVLNFFPFFQMGILLATANFDIFLDKTESAQRSTDAEDSENPLYRFVSRKNQPVFCCRIVSVYSPKT